VIVDEDDKPNGTIEDGDAVRKSYPTCSEVLVISIPAFLVRLPVTSACGPLMMRSTMRMQQL
jgi:hypothetical protein